MNKIQTISELPIKRVGLVYKYNKDIQINGTIFYAFEYLIKLIEEIYNKCDSYVSSDDTYKTSFWKAKKHDLPRLYIVCPSSMRVQLKENYLNLFIKRYPLTKSGGASFRVNSYYNSEAKMKLSKEDYNKYLDTKKLVTKAFDQIKFCSNLEYIKETQQLDTLIYTSFNTYIALKDNHPTKNSFVFQNRAIFQLNTKDIESIKDNTKNITTFLYETEYQKLPGIQKNQKQYNLKLGFKYFYQKELFSDTKYNELNTMICGKPSANRSNEILFDKGLKKSFIKPTKFLEVKGETGYFFSGIKTITYYRNFLKFEENNRIIPEALWYGFKINIFKEEENLNHLNFRNINNPENLPKYDTSVTRFNNIKNGGKGSSYNFKEYNLENESLLDTFNLVNRIDSVDHNIDITTKDPS